MAGRRMLKVAPTIAALLDPISSRDLAIRIVAWDGSSAGPAGAPAVRINSANALRRLIWNPGEVGLAHAYIMGDIDSPDDIAVVYERLRQAIRDRNAAAIDFTSRNLDRVTALLGRLGALGEPPAPPSIQAMMRGRQHTAIRDRMAVSFYYDLPVPFYALFLDASMAYSSGYWTSADPAYTLADAQRDKLELVCRKLLLGPGRTLLDVGCGWGALALHAAAEHGAQVTAITISRVQRDHVAAQVKDRGLGALVDVRLLDYRDLPPGEYDAIAALEMGEHVGNKTYGVFAEYLHRHLAPGGRLLVQQKARRGPDRSGGEFVASLVAPDLYMRPVGETVEILEMAGFEVRHVQSLREHMYLTSEQWRLSLEARVEEATAIVGPEHTRAWRLFLAALAREFRDGRMGLDQVLATKALPPGTALTDGPLPAPWRPDWAEPGGPRE